MEYGAPSFYFGVKSKKMVNQDSNQSTDIVTSFEGWRHFELAPLNFFVHF